MKFLVVGGVSCVLLIILWTGTGRSDCLPFDVAAPSTGHHEHGLDVATAAFVSHSGLSCACAVFTDVFRARKLDYARSPEFADAIRAVAGGTSRYSPSEIPADWATVAEEWGRHLATHREGEALPDFSGDVAGGGEGMIRVAGERESLVPALVYLASMEYRLRGGRRDVIPVFPWILRKAYAELEDRIAAKRRLAGEFDNRAAAIAAKISDAERSGAGDHAPDIVARAKFELALACRDAKNVHSSVRETGAAFDRAEKLAEAISRI